MSGAIAAASLVGILASTGVQIYQGVQQGKKQDEANKQQERFQEEATKRAKDQAERSSQNTNRANQKTADISSILASNQTQSNSGSGGMQFDQENTLQKKINLLGV